MRTGNIPSMMLLKVSVEVVIDYHRLVKVAIKVVKLHASLMRLQNVRDVVSFSLHKIGVFSPFIPENQQSDQQTIAES